MRASALATSARTTLVASCALAVSLSLTRAAAGQEDASVLVKRAGPAAPVAARLASTSWAWAMETRSTEGPTVFRSVPPGEYALSVGAARLVLRLDPFDSVTVEAATRADGSVVLRLLARASRAMGTVFDGDDLRRLPSGRDVASLLETAEPVTVGDRIDGGGLFTADPPRLTAHGGSWTETTYVLDGIDVTDPLRGGRPLVLPHVDALAAATLVSSALPAEVPGGASAVVLSSLSPSAAWQGTVRAESALGKGTSDGSPPPREHLRSWRDVGVMAHGPAADGRAGVLGAFEWRRSTRVEGGEATPLPSQLASALGQATWRPSEGETLATTALVQWATRPAEPGLWRGGPDAHDDRAFASARWERGARDGRLFSLRAGYARARTSGLAASPTIERLLDGPLPEQVEDRPAARDRAEAGLAFHPALVHAGGEHDLHFALSAARASAALEPFAAAVGEEVDGRAARVWEYASAGTSRPRAYEAAAVAGDTLRAGRLQADAGLRLDFASGGAAGAPRGLRWWTLSPSLALRFAAPGDRLVLRGAASRRAQALRLSWLEWGDPASPSALVRRWVDASGDGVPDAGERGIVVGRAGPGAPAAALDASLRRPYTDEVMLAIEGRLADALVVRFAGIDRREHRLIESVNVGLGAGAYATRLVPDPGGDLAHAEDDQLLPIADRRAPGEDDLFLLTNPAGLDASYRGVELVFDLHLRDLLRLLLSATAHRVDGDAASRGFRPTENDPGLVGERFDTPNADTNPEGRLFFDRAYTIKLAGRVRVPGDLHLGWVARYQDGQPFARLVLATDLRQGPDLVRAVPDGRHRFSYTLTVDARLEKGIRIGSRRLSASVEAFNLLQTRHEVEEDVLSGPAFRTPTLVQPPRVVRAGLRLDF